MAALGDGDHTDSPNQWHQANIKQGDEVRVIYLSSISYCIDGEPVDGSATMLYSAIEVTAGSATTFRNV